jgi:predicted DCC family thiol-disulfide oxidoreductase YuxK
MQSSSTSIILYDGVCNLCNWFVQFVIKLDKMEMFRFAALQSEIGVEILKRVPFENFELATVVLLSAEKVYIESVAVLKILKGLGGMWSMLYLFVIVPKPIRDGLYRIVSRYRHRIFRHRKSCIVPTTGVLNKIIT